MHANRPASSRDRGPRQHIARARRAPGLRSLRRGRWPAGRGFAPRTDLRLRCGADRCGRKDNRARKIPRAKYRGRERRAWRDRGGPSARGWGHAWVRTPRRRTLAPGPHRDAGRVERAPRITTGVRPLLRLRVARRWPLQHPGPRFRVYSALSRTDPNRGIFHRLRNWRTRREYVAAPILRRTRADIEQK